MGVVYLARDARLERDVAIKALPEELAQNPVSLERFEREAKAIAGLSHQNIAGIYGVEEQDGAKYLILEYIDGLTLADRLDAGQLPVDEALEVAVQISTRCSSDQIHSKASPQQIPSVRCSTRSSILTRFLRKHPRASASSSADASNAIRHNAFNPSAMHASSCRISIGKWNPESGILTSVSKSITRGVGSGRRLQSCAQSQQLPCSSFYARAPVYPRPSLSLGYRNSRTFRAPSTRPHSHPTENGALLGVREWS